MMTNDEYVGHKGRKCPFCGRDDLQGHEVTIEPGVALQDVDCLDCGKSWQDVYKLIAFEEV